jgi:transcriptional regulator GlxA family with amidase domain
MSDVDVTAGENITIAFEKMNVEWNICFEDALRSISEFDINMVACGPPADLEAVIISAKVGETKKLDLISAFVNQRVDEDRPKWLMSVFTGAGFLATCVCLGGKTVTSHWAYLDTLDQICKHDNSSGQTTTVVRKR